MRAVYAVGRAGWPFNVFALFSSEREASRHAHGSGDDLEVFPLPVYDTYDDCPAGARMDDSGIPRAWRSLPEDEMGFARMAAESADLTDLPATVYSVGGFNAEPYELYVVYDTAEQAQRHVDCGYVHLAARPMTVYATHDQCLNSKSRPGTA